MPPIIARVLLFLLHLAYQSCILAAEGVAVCLDCLRSMVYSGAFWRKRVLPPASQPGKQLRSVAFILPPSVVAGCGADLARLLAFCAEAGVEHVALYDTAGACKEAQEVLADGLRLAPYPLESQRGMTLTQNDRSEARKRRREQQAPCGGENSDQTGAESSALVESVNVSVLGRCGGQCGCSNERSESEENLQRTRCDAGAWEHVKDPGSSYNVNGIAHQRSRPNDLQLESHGYKNGITKRLRRGANGKVARDVVDNLLDSHRDLGAHVANGRKWDTNGNPAGRKGPHDMSSGNHGGLHEASRESGALTNGHVNDDSEEDGEAYKRRWKQTEVCSSSQEQMSARMSSSTMAVDLLAEEDGKCALGLAADWICRNSAEALSQHQGAASDDGAQPATTSGQPLEEGDVDKALEATGGLTREPELVLVFGRVLTVAGFPPWLLRNSEIVHIRSLRGITASSFQRALEEFSCRTQRFGR